VHTAVKGTAATMGIQYATLGSAATICIGACYYILLYIYIFVCTCSPVMGCFGHVRVIYMGVRIQSSAVSYSTNEIYMGVPSLLDHRNVCIYL